MPDITMCENSSCPLKQGCFRYMAKPSEYRQSYSNFEYTIEDGVVECGYFMEIWKKKNDESNNRV